MTKQSADIDVARAKDARTSAQAPETIHVRLLGEEVLPFVPDARMAATLDDRTIDLIVPASKAKEFRAGPLAEIGGRFLRGVWTPAMLSSIPVSLIGAWDGAHRFVVSEWSWLRDGTAHHGGSPDAS